MSELLRWNAAGKGTADVEPLQARHYSGGTLAMWRAGLAQCATASPDVSVIRGNAPLPTLGIVSVGRAADHSNEPLLHRQTRWSSVAARQLSAVRQDRPRP